MSEIDLRETAVRRAFRDFKSALGTLWFWILDAGGAAVIGAVADPVWGVIWLVGIALVTFAFLWEQAPFKQRDEARAGLTERICGDPDRIDMEAAGRLWRDLLVEHQLSDAIHMYDDMIESDHGGKGRVESAFRFIASEGINERVIEAWAVPEFGSKKVKLEEIDESVDAWRYFSEEGDPDFLMTPDGVKYRNLEFSRVSVESYAKAVREHDAELKRRLQKKKLSEFIKEHEADPDGDLDKLDALIKRPVQGSEKATRKASSRDASDD